MNTLRKGLTGVDFWGWAFIVWNASIVLTGIFGLPNCAEGNASFVQCQRGLEDSIVKGALLWLAVNALLGSSAFVFSGTSTWSERKTRGLILLGGVGLAGVGFVLIQLIEKFATAIS